MRELKPEFRVSLRWWEWLLCLAALLSGSAQAPGLGVIAALLAGICFGVWRCVYALGLLLLYGHGEPSE